MRKIPSSIVSGARTKVLAVAVAVAVFLPLASQPSYACDVAAPDGCGKANLQYNEFLYKEDINGLNMAAALYVVSHPNYEMGNLASYMVTVYLNQPVELAGCLRANGINPASVAQLTPLAYGALVYDKKALDGFSPDFVEEIPAPCTATS